MSSYANALGSQPKPDERLRALRTAYQELSPLTMLREALGYFGDEALPGTPAIGAPLVKHMIVICVDTESHTLNTDMMTELGMSYVSRKNARAVGNPGPHGWRLQEALKFFHFRIAEHAHLKSNRENSLGPLGNRFGKTRFTTFQELRVILEQMFNKEIETTDPELKGCKCPIVLVGHALKHDLENAKKEGLNYEFADNSTIVAKVDTQALARQVKLWIPPPEMWTNEIGLRVLIEKLGFKHLDDHTACNDAARTMMCAIHMVLPENLLESDNPSMQAVADRVEKRSLYTSPAPYGTVLCCIRCGWRDHSAEVCTANVTCAACTRFDAGPDREQNVHSHIETYCPHVARFKAWARRFRDASKKHGANLKAFPDAVRSGPGPDAHPWSTWPREIRWPLKDLSDVLVGMNMTRQSPQLREPPAFARNMQIALGDFPIPPTGSWVMVSPHGSINPMTATASSAAPLRSSSMSMGALSSAFPATNGNTTSTTAFPSLPAPNGTAAASTPAAARRETTMSEQRGRRGCAWGNRSGRGGQGRRGAPSGRGDGDAAANAPIQNPYGWH